MDARTRIDRTRHTRGARRRGFTIRDLAVLLVCLMVTAGLVVSLAGANRDLSHAAVCAANLHTLFGGLTAYVNAYNSYPPHNPYPGYVPAGESSPAPGFDPNIGWILTYGLGLTPPATYSNGHFKWHGIDTIDDLPDVAVCPAANLQTLLPPSPEVEANAFESTVSKYALFYQTSGTCRAATMVIQEPIFPRSGIGGRNPVIPDPTSFAARPTDNATGGVPSVWVGRKTGDPTDPGQYDNEVNCYVQAVSPFEVDSPGRVYYLADTRDYRPMASGTTYSWPPAGTNNGWLSGWGNKIFLGTRHYEYANVMYLDGRVTRDNQTHDPRWNMNYVNGQTLSSQWRAATFADDINLAMIHTQGHVMPQLNVKGWEYFFSSDGVAAK